MGEVVRKDAAVGTILEDVETTYTKALARGGDWQTEAEARLGPVRALAATVNARLKEAEAAAAPALAALDAGNDESDKLLGRIADDVWNDVGRPGQDPALDIIFPGGASYYAEGDTEEQPDRMALLAELLESGIHPRLEAAKATAYATEVRQSAARLEEKVDAARPLKVRVKLATKMRQAIARNGAIALRRLKAAWKADGRTEAEIHAIIPDRPTRKRRSTDADPAPTT